MNGQKIVPGSAGEDGSGAPTAAVAESEHAQQLHSWLGGVLCSAHVVSLMVSRQQY